MTQHLHSNFHTTGGSCPPLHSQHQREGSQIKNPQEVGGSSLSSFSLAGGAAAGEARLDQWDTLGAVPVSPAPCGRCRGHKGRGQQLPPLRTWTSWGERMCAFNTLKLCSGICHGNGSFSTQIGVIDIWGQAPFPRISFTISHNEHGFTSRDTLLSYQLRSQQGQTAIPLLPLTRTQFFKTVFTKAPATTWTPGRQGSQRIP